jgi:hypothetical protein
MIGLFNKKEFLEISLAIGDGMLVSTEPMYVNGQRVLVKDFKINFAR